VPIETGMGDLGIALHCAREPKPTDRADRTPFLDAWCVEPERTPCASWATPKASSKTPRNGPES